MQRSVTNTLRTAAVILTATLVVGGCIFLVFLSEFNAEGGFAGVRNRTAAANYMFAAVVLGFLGVSFIVWLGRRIYLDRPVASAAQAGTRAGASLRQFSPTARLVLVRLAWCLGILLAVDALDSLYSVIQIQQAFREQPARYHSLILTLMAFVISDAPYALLIYFVRNRPTRTVLAFALAFPAIATLQMLITVFPAMGLYSHDPVSLAVLIIALVMAVVTILVAYQAANRAKLQASGSSLFTAVAASVVYCSCSSYLVFPAIRRMILK